jgi:hypothetical protein
MSGLLRQSLEADRGTQGECLSPDILAAYYERSLASGEMSRCEDHVSHCFGCRQQLAVLARMEPLPQEQPRHVWLLDWRLLLSATAALLILTVWGVRRSAVTPAVANQPLVAMSRAEQAYPPQDSLHSPQSPLSTPATPPNVAGKSLLQQELNKVSPQPQTPASEGPRVAQKKLSRDLPLHASGAENALKMRSDVQAAGQPNRLIESKVLDQKSASPTAPLPSQPTVMLQSAAPPSASNARVGAGAGSVTSGDDAGAPAELPSANQQSQSGVISDRPGAANGLPAQSAEQRSAQTIIPTPNPKVLWRIAGGGFIERSQDGGATWHGQLPESNAHFTAGAAPATKVLWLVGENGMILLTKDASHWKKISPPIPADFVSVEASSATSAAVTAADRQKFSTSNSGKKWVPVH